MTKRSRKHHYLPVHYLKGFCNPDDRIHVYSKKEKRFLLNQSPTSKFYGKDLNTVKVAPNNIVYYEELIMQNHDDLAAPLLRKLREMGVNAYDPLNIEERVYLVWFVLNLFWRIPSSGNALRQILNTEGINSKYFKLKGENVTSRKEKSFFQNMLKFIKNNTELQKVFKLLYPHISLESEEVVRIAEKWKLLICQTDAFGFITGDNPFVISNPRFNSENILNEFIFPLNRRHALVITDSNLQFLEGHLMAHVNLSIFQKSENLVCAADEAILKKTVDVFEHFEKLEPNKNWEINTFNLLRLEAEYSTYEDYIRSAFPTKAEQFLSATRI